MAERSNATAKNSQDAVPDVSALQKRGRRRLVGAIALVLLAVIVLPMVFDPEPKPRSGAPLVNIRIPSEEGGAFAPKEFPKPAPEPAPAAPVPAPAAAVAPTPAVASAPTAAAPAQAPQAAEKPVEKALEKAVDRKTEKKTEQPSAKAEPAKPAAAGAEQWLYQVGAFASAEKVKEISDQLRSARLPHYTETVATAKGKVTRVRLGPFTSRQAAEHALERARALGLNPVNVAPK